MKYALFLVAFVAIGCGKKAVERADEPSNSPSASATPAKSEIPAVAPDKPKEPPPPGLSAKSDGVTVAVDQAILVDVETLLVVVAVSTENVDKKINFRSWRELGTSRGVVGKDSKGNRCLAKPFDLLLDGMLRQRLTEQRRADIGWGTGPVTEDKPRGDMLLFDPPVKTADYLDLELDAKNVEKKGTIRLRIPRSMWDQPKGK